MWKHAIAGGAPLHIAVRLGHAAVLLVAGAPATATTSEEQRTPRRPRLSASDEPRPPHHLDAPHGRRLFEAADSRGVLAVQLARRDQLPALMKAIRERGSGVHRRDPLAVVFSKLFHAPLIVYGPLIILVPRGSSACALP